MPRLSALAQQGLLTAAAAEALSAKSIHSVEDLLFLTCNGFHDVMARTGMCEGELQEIVKTVSREYGPIPQCASDVYTEWYRSTSILSTGSAQLDSLLKGGLFSGEITELAGPCAAGKTQVCLAVSVRTCRAGDGVAFFDTGTSFSLDRAKEIAKMQHRAWARQDPSERAQEGDGDEQPWDAPLLRLRVFAVPSADVLLWQLSALEQQLESPEDPALKNLKLIVIDSLGTAFSPIIGGASHVAHALLVSVVQVLQRLARKYNVSVLVTNHTTSGVNLLLQHQPALGDTWSHLACVAISLSSSDLDVPCRRAQVRKSNKNNTLAEAEFYLCSSGIADWPSGTAEKRTGADGA